MPRKGVTVWVERRDSGAYYIMETECDIGSGGFKAPSLRHGRWEPREWNALGGLHLKPGAGPIRIRNVQLKWDA